MCDLRKIIQHMEPDGCVLVFNSHHNNVTTVVYRHFNQMLEAHRINGEFLNMGKSAETYDLYICLRGALDE